MIQPKHLIEAYNAWYRELLTKGTMPFWSTEKGFWGATPNEALIDFFHSLKLGRYTSFCDLGSGDGKVVLLAALYGLHAEGIECDERLHTQAVRMKQKFWISNATFHLKDYFQHDISGYDVVYISPDQSPHRGLSAKLMKELRGHLIVYGHHFHPDGLKQEYEAVVGDTLFTYFTHPERKPKIPLIDKPVLVRDHSR